MIQIIILLISASIPLCVMTEECNCGIGFYLNIQANNCQPNPSFEETGYVENCIGYKQEENSSTPGEYYLYCNECSETTMKTPVSFTTFTCKPKEIPNCINVYISPRTRISKCLECQANYYIKDRICEEYPISSQTDAFIQGCSKYYYATELLCLECSVDGYYGDVSNSSDRKCVDAGNSIDKCMKYLNLSECGTCQAGKVLQLSAYGFSAGPACVDPPSDMPGCIEFDTLDGVAFRCLKCSGLYFLRSNFSGCDSSGSSIDNCDEYDGVGSCGTCAFQYYKNGDSSECLKCLTHSDNCTHNDDRKVCKSVFNSDCASAGVDTTLFTDFQGPSCIKNQCLEKFNALKNKFTIAPPNFSTLNLIDYMGYDAFCFQTKVIIKASSDIVSHDQIVNTDLTQCASPCELEIIYQFRNMDYDIAKQSGSFTYTGSSEISGLSSSNDQVSNMYPSGPLSSGPEQLNTGFSISVRKESDFSTDAAVGDIVLGTEIYYKVISLQADAVIDISKFKVYLKPSGTLSESNKILLPSTGYTLVPDTGNEYYELTITKNFIGEFNISVAYE